MLHMFRWYYYIYGIKATFHGNIIYSHAGNDTNKKLGMYKRYIALWKLCKYIIFIWVVCTYINPLSYRDANSDIQQWTSRSNLYPPTISWYSYFDIRSHMFPKMALFPFATLFEISLFARTESIGQTNIHIFYFFVSHTHT